jgi:ParB family chromosome partitioning protein
LMDRRDRLGKGLGALLGEYMEPEVDASEIRRVPVANIVPNPLQPRRTFTDSELEELSASIQENGLLQPLVVRPAPAAPDRFEIVAGERRFRAVSRLGWADVPALVRDASDETLLVLALVENLQRSALNPLEEAEGYQALMDRFSMNQGEVARAVGKSRPAVANTLRLLKLPPSVRALLEAGSLSMGHARALLSVEDEIRAGQLARNAAREGWSVREVERRVGETQVSADGKRRTRVRKPRDPVGLALEEALQDLFATRVRIKQDRTGKGSIEITYHGAEDFERIFELMTGHEVGEVIG